MMETDQILMILHDPAQTLSHSGIRAIIDHYICIAYDLTVEDHILNNKPATNNYQSIRR